MNITIEKEIDYSNDCPFLTQHIDASSCYDSFDEPNFEYYCKHKDADNSNTPCEEFNDDIYGKFIAIEYAGCFHCDIPTWCPFRKVNN